MIGDTYIPFGKPDFSDGEGEAVLRILRSGWVGMGPETLAFEKELAEVVGAPQVVTVSSCTAAMFLALKVHGVGPGDEVICPSLTWCSTANVVLYAGAVPVFCDVDPDSMSLTPETVRAKLTSRTRAVLAVHLGGLAIDVAELLRVLPSNVALIEDAAHALGSRYPDGRAVGSSGQLCCFSFYANKNLSTGEGGAIALYDEEQAARLRSLRQHGLPVDAWKRFSHPRALLRSELTELGYKLNYTDLQACIGRVQLRRQPEFHARRLAIAKHYFARLNGLVPVLFQKDVLSEGHSRHLFLLRLPMLKGTMRDELVLKLREKNVGASIHYAPLHAMPLYGVSGSCRLPATEAICQQLVTLPISASITIEETAYVTEALVTCLEDLRV